MFNELTINEQQDINGGFGLVFWLCVGGASLVGGFGVGYVLARIFG